jgi:hypothetical protein
VRAEGSQAVCPAALFQVSQAVACTRLKVVVVDLPSPGLHFVAS